MERLYCAQCGRKANADGKCPVHSNAEMDRVNPIAGLVIIVGTTIGFILAIISIA